MSRLQHRVAVVTGGGRGIGRATAALFLREGACVDVWEVSPRGADRVREQLREELGSTAGERLHVELVDVADPSEVETALQSTQSRRGGLDILVNNAGIIADGFATDLTLEDWERVLRVNLTGTFLCSQAAIPLLRARGGGSIINTSSISALGNKGQVNYSASKAGVVGLTRTLAKELARDAIRVNAVAPGVIDTEMFALVPEKVRSKFLARVPLGRLGEPLDIARLHLFLASDDSAYITGQTIFCDGGVSLGE